MSRFHPWPGLLAAAVALVVTAGLVHFWLTIPATLEPEALPSCVLEPPSAAWRDAVETGRDVARRLAAEEKLPGLSLAVAVDGELVWAEGFGWADLEARTPSTPETTYRIGGVTEAFTSVAVGRLVEQGRLDFDAPVRRYLPDLPERDAPLALRRLMSHTSGLRPYGGDGGIFRGHCADDADRLALLAAEPMASAPGEKVAYTARGGALVGAVVAAAAGEAYPEVLRREILAPLGLAHTSLDLGAPAPDRARPYYPRVMLDPRYGLQDAPTTDLSCVCAAVGLLSTPSDLARFGAALTEGRPLDPATLRELQTPALLASGAHTDHGLGWIVREIPLGDAGAPTRIVGQGLDAPVLRRPLSATTAAGQIAGATATLLIVPDHHVVVAAATNVTGAANVPRLALRLAGIFVQAR